MVCGLGSKPLGVLVRVRCRDPVRVGVQPEDPDLGSAVRPI